MPRSITYTDNGDSTHTLAAEWTYASSQMDTVLQEASEYFYNARWTIYDGEGEPIAWADLTNVQKRYVLLYEITYHLKQGAHSLYSNTEIQTTKDGLQDPDTRYNMVS